MVRGGQVIQIPVAEIVVGDIAQVKYGECMTLRAFVYSPGPSQRGGHGHWKGWERQECVIVVGHGEVTTGLSGQKENLL